MKLKNMFEKDINRNINGVVKVGDDNLDSVQQELDEYIITRELRRHFSTFLENYTAALDQPTDKMGVWISGFFGSGKSHFLKMLSYLLENKEVNGKTAFEYFEDKFDDAYMEAEARRATGVPTEAILFNIDIEGKKKNKEAIKNVFAKVFYDHLGYYGSDLKVVHLEQFLDEEGKLEDFKEEFEKRRGKSWEEARARYRFHQDGIVKSLMTVCGMSEDAAKNAFKGEDTNELSIKNLVSDIKKYVDSKGKNFRLLFMVDEIGQYIGNDSDLMLNLQSLVEEIGTQCKGQVWVMVTSQEAIDEIVKVSGDDFSKIQGRFNTRLSLSSSSVDEVIEKRVLAKNEEAASLLEMEYNKEQAVLKNLYTFSDSVLDIKGYTGAEEFAMTYPFVPYQFKIIQDVLSQIRKHGNSGKHLSSGERSMLSAFQEAAQKVQDKDETSLVPFYNFYDTVHTFLDSPIRRVIERCQNAAEHHDGIEPRDVDVLKLLYLVRYLDDIKANVDNIAILMIDNIETDKINLRKEVQASLDRLYNQNYISRNGDTYYFLTDEEQDIARDIKNTPVDTAQIIKAIGDTVYDDIFTSKRFKYGKNDFSFNQYVDETQHGAPVSGMGLRFITVAHDQVHNDMWLMNQTFSNPEAFIVLPEDNDYFNQLEEAKKIDKYVKKQNTSAQPETVQEIIAKKRREMRQLESRAKDSLEKAILDGKVYVGGESINVLAGNAKAKIEQVLSKLAEHVYNKNYMIETNVDSDADILKILNSKHQQMNLDGLNDEAMEEVGTFLETRKKLNQPTSMGEIQKRYQDKPYGWKQIDIAAVVARLLVGHQIELKYGGQKISPTDRKIVDYLRNPKDVDKVQVSRRIAVSEDLKRKSVKFLRDYLNRQDVPETEQELVDFTIEQLELLKNHYQDLLNNEYRANIYPDKELVEEADELLSEILSRKNDNDALLSILIKKQDDLLDSQEDLEVVEDFFKSQKSVFDNARKYLLDLNREKDYFFDNDQMKQLMDGINSILKMDHPYNQIKKLPELVQEAKGEYSKLLNEKLDNLEAQIDRGISEIETKMQEMKGPNSSVSEGLSFLKQKKEAVKKNETLTQMDAAVTQVSNLVNNTLATIQRVIEAQNKTKTPPIKPVKPYVPPKKVEHIYRGVLCPAKTVTSEEDVNNYVENIRKELLRLLSNNDGVKIE
ncbi:BREX system P-loop protein BrxC [Faecalibaculum rodentium]|uniref:BREX system P-loop protein BrxC n=5 Tax=Erysipelotrichaceae TaxID=128827 RepID=UPI0025740BAB|nr:BREX system P-loop protein BrxC [Faecalibaculum rodentium]